MTSNQIAYKNAKEVERHNLAAEQETQRHQKMQEALTRWSNALNEYQIAVNNAHYRRMDAETERANRAREGANLMSIGETARSNVANEDIRRQANQIQAMGVAETSRHQRRMEGIQEELNASLIEKYSADTGYTEAKTESENVLRTYVLPSQADMNKSQADLNREKTNTEYTQRWVNIMSGFSQGARAIKDLGGLAVDLVTLGGSKTFQQPTEADRSRSFWNQLEVEVNK